MTFVARVREELCRVDVRTPGEAAYELYGAALACGRGIATRHTLSARRFLSLARRFPERFGEASMRREDEGRFGAGAEYRLEIERLPQDLPEPETSEHAAALVRGAFLCRGAVASPESRAQANITVAGEDAARVIAGAMEALEAAPGRSVVRGKISLYIRSGERIAELLGRIGASGAYMEMESASVMKQMRSGVNRQVNCDHANIAKQQRASEKQIAAIEKIRSAIGLDRLPGALEEIALLRLEHEEASLEELGALCEPPSGKSGVNSRFRRLMEIAAKLE
ncbi:MAG: DNA-binding protein WhiA [Eubacteriales bacterium]|nr:DNA-binding protein WhiA [Eubacteriales bacterium]